MGRSSGVRRQHLPGAAAGRTGRGPCLGGDHVCDHLGGSGRQPDVPRNHVQHRGCANGERSQAAGLLRGLPQLGAIRARRAERWARLAGRVPGRHDQAGAPHHLSREVGPHGGRPPEPDRRDRARGRDLARDHGRLARGLHGQPVQEHPARHGPRSGLSQGGARAGRQREDHRRAAGPHQGFEKARGLGAQRADGDPEAVLDSDRVPGVCAARDGARPDQPQGRQACELRARHRRHLRLLHDHAGGPVRGQGAHRPRLAGDVAAGHHPGRHRHRVPHRTRRVDPPARGPGGAVARQVPACQARGRRRHDGRPHAPAQGVTGQARAQAALRVVPAGQPARRLHRADASARGRRHLRGPDFAVLYLQVLRSLGKAAEGFGNPGPAAAVPSGTRRRNTFITASRSRC